MENEKDEKSEKQEKDGNGESDENTPRRQQSETPALEWLTAALGLLLVLATIGFLVYDAVTEQDTPPQIAVASEEIIQTDTGFLVKFEIENKGDNHAADVGIEGKLMDGAAEKESASSTIPYAPSHSRRTGGLFFTENPRKYKLELRVLGYSNP